MSKNAVGKELFALAGTGAKQRLVGGSIIAYGNQQAGARAAAPGKGARRISQNIAAASVISGVWVARRALLAGQLYT